MGAALSMALDFPTARVGKRMFWSNSPDLEGGERKKGKRGKLAPEANDEQKKCDLRRHRVVR